MAVKTLLKKSISVSLKKLFSVYFKYKLFLLMLDALCFATVKVTHAKMFPDT